MIPIKLILPSTISLAWQMCSPTSMLYRPSSSAATCWMTSLWQQPSTNISSRSEGASSSPSLYQATSQRGVDIVHSRITRWFSSAVRSRRGLTIETGSSKNIKQTWAGETEATQFSLGVAAYLWKLKKYLTFNLEVSCRFNIFGRKSNFSSILDFDITYQQEMFSPWWRRTGDLTLVTMSVLHPFLCNAELLCLDLQFGSWLYW